MQPLPSTVLLDEARQATAWSSLWRRLLQPIPDDDEPEADDASDRAKDEAT